MKKFCLIIVLFGIFAIVSYGKPMESFKNYNVVLVHGAGGSRYGLDCNATILEANGYERDKDGYLELIGGYGNKLFFVDRKSSAEDMDIDNDGLHHWLTEKVFEKDTAVYLQRSFTNPANSPINNAKEIGYRKWQGNNKCNVRRSLIEEAQEVRAAGRKNLKELRESVVNRDDLPPSRNILIAHSMGGVASREYVQGTGYNNDVDKVITLDSPHEGTGALNMLLEMGDLETGLH